MPHRSRFKALSFDGDRTLWDFESSMVKAMTIAVETLREKGLDRDGEPVTVAWMASVRDEVAARESGSNVPMDSIRLAAFKESVRRCGSEDMELAEKVCRRYFADRRRVLEPFPDARPALERWRGRFSLALVTNGNTLPSTLGMEEYFTTVVMAAEENVYKPDPAIYRLAAERLGTDPEKTVHIGDNLVEDVAAAQAAGMRAVWLNRDGATADADVRPDAEISSLDGIAEALDAIAA
ncbi:HAD family hydrolase [Salininema proteolyticum]|uniref:HAD family hydrolase n=1 Tax=Salininema proteolyticum TaxID=1607685 RepID=A0ABV8U5F6_9ACTN